MMCVAFSHPFSEFCNAFWQLGPLMVAVYALTFIDELHLQAIAALHRRIRCLIYQTLHLSDQF